MESVQFIPNSQKKNIPLSKKVKRLSYKVLGIVSSVSLVLLAGVLFSLQSLVLSRQVADLKDKIQEVDLRVQQYYPEGDLASTVFVASVFTREEFPIEEVLPTVKQAFLPQLKVRTLSYSKKNKQIKLSVTMDSVESIVKQEDAFREVERVKKIESSNITSVLNSSEKNADIIITLE